MKRLLFLLMASAAWTATLSGTATAQECPNGGPGSAVYGPEYSNGGLCKKGRKEATKPPPEAFGVHPPGIDPYDARRIFHRWRHIFYPYYAPLSPVATSARWKPWCYFPLLPWYTPYYIGYCPHRLCNPKPQPYGSNGWGDGPMPIEDPHAIGPPPLNFGVYTSVITDDTIFWNMGGNGLVPYGAPRPPHLGPPDLVDSIRSARAQYYGFGSGCQGLPGGVPVAAAGGPAAPAILPPTETGGPSNAQPSDRNATEAAPAEAAAEKAGSKVDAENKEVPAEEPAPPAK